MVILNLLLLTASLAWAGVLYQPRQEPSATVPDYFQTTPEIFAGPTATGLIAPFLAQTNPAPFGHEASFVPNAPLETNLPISGNTNRSSIFQLQGHLSSYFPNPVGFGVNEYPVPPGSNISQVHLLHRHGSRYPTGSASVAVFGQKIYHLTTNKTASWSGELSFLQNWKYQLGAETLVTRGHQELFDSGVLFYYNYGQLYNTSTKIIARTTSQDRMRKSAEYFMAGFFGLDWTNNVTLEIIIEQDGLNNSLSGASHCNNSNSYRAEGGNNASLIWENMYLANATQRFRSMSGDYNWTVADSYNAQTLCPYETVAFGYSAWCELFTFEEWQGFEYSIDLQFNGNNGFASPTGRGVGIGWVEELYERLQGQLPNLPAGSTNINTTLDEMNSTFPLNQTLYFDFSHDTNIMSVITAFGLKQFAQPLPETGPPADQQLVVSHVTPFAARMVWEIIKAPYPVKAIRPSGTNTSTSDFYDKNGNATTYVHLSLNQRTVPLHRSYAECQQRDDGWCELSTILQVFDGLLNTARFEYSCFGEYPSTPYGNVTDGTPTTKRSLTSVFGTGLEFGESSDRWRE
ncbi:hypothetical protein PV10_00928 [Exophiala mesophila]|uniref:3-phytase n=1 Tax=Exophiala mesophila TaxID=212818 RepID=A0A0D1Y8Z8_EXOME|nr:uncharacterized protein PV10_00928 [Exophiala mesophila]KIV97146.1 hypothetical protein PV10_00928 [Exophiala mesophila]